MTNSPEINSLSEAEAHALLQKALTQYAGVLKKMGAGVMPQASEVEPAMDMIRGELERLRARISDLEAEKNGADSLIDALEKVKNGAYKERNSLVAALAKLFPASIEKDPEATSMEWVNVVIIDLPTGQASWHIPQSDLEQFSFLPVGGGRKWDGHTSEEKYRRVAALSKFGYWQNLVGDTFVIAERDKKDTAELADTQEALQKATSELSAIHEELKKATIGIPFMHQGAHRSPGWPTWQDRLWALLDFKDEHKELCAALIKATTLDIDTGAKFLTKPIDRLKFLVSRLPGIRPADDKPHQCYAKSTKNGGFGMAIESCYEDGDGRLIVTNDEYSNPVDFCPFCGAKARTPVP